MTNKLKAELASKLTNIPSGISRLRAFRAEREIWQFLTLREIARNPREIWLFLDLEKKLAFKCVKTDSLSYYITSYFKIQAWYCVHGGLQDF